METAYIFADESGNFDFSIRKGATKYFIITTVTFLDVREACAAIDQLKYELLRDGYEVSGSFHASEDKQEIRDRVFEVIQQYQFRIDSIIFNKRKAMPHLQFDIFLYPRAWHYLLRYLLPRVAGGEREAFILAASLGTGRSRKVLQEGVSDVVQKSAFKANVHIAHWPAGTDPGLQIADYCSWAIFRKWERGDERSYRLIKDKIRSEFDIFRHGNTLYY